MMRILFGILLLVGMACAGATQPASVPDLASPILAEDTPKRPLGPSDANTARPHTADTLPVIATQVRTEDIDYFDSGDMPWHYWTAPVGKPNSSSTLAPQGARSYGVSNLADADAATAWVEGTNGPGVSEHIEFTLHDYGDGVFGDVRVFFGVVWILNGYHRTDATWQENGRVKRMRVFFNDAAFAEVTLSDTQRLQILDLTPHFNVPRYRNPNPSGFAPKEGDKLRFEIIEVYPGTKYADTAISEFLAIGGGG